MTYTHDMDAHRSAALFISAQGLRKDADTLADHATRVYTGTGDDVVVVVLSESLLASAIGNFLDLNDGGECRSTNPEYYRGGFELIRQTFVFGQDDLPAEWLASRIAAHPQWSGGADALPL